MELVWETRASRGIMIERGDRTIKQGGPILREHSTSTLSILLIKKKRIITIIESAKMKFFFKVKN